MQLDHDHHLSYCTNIHPAETWEETLGALQEHTLRVRDMVGAATLPSGSQPQASRRYAIGLRLSACAAEELLKNDNLPRFQNWLAEENCYVFTINGFPYGAFHGTRVKENVYRPDWSTPERLTYTNQLFEIISQLAPESGEGSVSTLPGSFKAFNADESAIFRNLEACARHIEELSGKTGRDLHLGLEPEPLGHFENTQDTLAFFERLLDQSEDPDLLRRRLGLNYDTCHFAVEFDDCRESLDAFRQAGLRISKVHLSNALAFDPGEVLEWMFARGLRATLEAYGGNASHGLVGARDGAVELARWTGEMRDAMQSHPGHSRLMSALRQAAFTEDGSLLFVNAGIEAARPLDTQGDSLWWGDGFDKITEPYNGFKMIVRGYDRKKRGVRITAHTASLDGGCGDGGGPLQAACFDMSGACIEQIEG